MLFGGTRVPHDGTARVTKIEFTTKQEAHLWQRDRAKLDTLSVNVQRYSQNHAQNWIFWATLWGIRSNISALSKIFNKKKPCSRVS